MKYGAIVIGREELPFFSKYLKAAGLSFSVLESPFATIIDVTYPEDFILTDLLKDINAAYNKEPKE